MKNLFFRIALSAGCAFSSMSLAVTSCFASKSRVADKMQQIAAMLRNSADEMQQNAAMLHHFAAVLGDARNTVYAAVSPELSKKLNAIIAAAEDAVRASGSNFQDIGTSVIFHILHTNMAKQEWDDADYERLYSFTKLSSAYRELIDDLALSFKDDTVQRSMSFCVRVDMLSRDIPQYYGRIAKFLKNPSISNCSTPGIPGGKTDQSSVAVNEFSHTEPVPDCATAWLIVNHIREQLLAASNLIPTRTEMFREYVAQLAPLFQQLTQEKNDYIRCYECPLFY
ncbi:MAG: hypothetical protein LBF84_01365 [Holosporales bacterium]|jgi:hypothetical protein|nr:hypothetical protein [Holosporales bacterium]